MADKLQMIVGAPIDEVLAAVKAGHAPPADERRWFVIEIVDGKARWTAHNVSLTDAFANLHLCALDVLDVMRQQNHAHE